MRYISLIIVLVLITGCRRPPEQCKQINIWYNVVIEAKSVIGLQEQDNDVWLTYSEIYPKDVDCDGAALWQKGRAEELGADMQYVWVSLFKHNDAYEFHMALVIEGLWKNPVVIPSSGMWEMDTFVSLEEYEAKYKMKRIESFQIEVIE